MTGCLETGSDKQKPSEQSTKNGVMYISHNPNKVTTMYPRVLGNGLNRGMMYSPLASLACTIMSRVKTLNTKLRYGEIHRIVNCAY